MSRPTHTLRGTVARTVTVSLAHACEKQHTVRERGLNIDSEHSSKREREREREKEKRGVMRTMRVCDVSPTLSTAWR